MTLAGRIAVMRDGVIEQVAPPLAIYARPVNRSSRSSSGPRR